MKLIFSLLMLICTINVSAQDIVVEPETQINFPDPASQKVTNSPIVIFGDEVNDSQFYVFFKAFSISNSSADFESDMKMPKGSELEFDIDNSQVRLMPLDFRIGFENKSWGSFAEILINDELQSSELVIYSKNGNTRVGPGFLAKIENKEFDVKSNGEVIGTEKKKNTEVAAYLYAAFTLLDNQMITVEQWNKAGISFEKTDEDNAKIEAFTFLINPAIDLMFKINKKLQIGTGVELSYGRVSGEFQAGNSLNYEGVGNIFSYELNLIKAKFLF